MICSVQPQQELNSGDDEACEVNPIVWFHQGGEGHIARIREEKMLTLATTLEGEKQTGRLGSLK
jgi:hypothetical protein